MEIELEIGFFRNARSARRAHSEGGSQGFYSGRSKVSWLSDIPGAREGSAGGSQSLPRARPQGAPEAAPKLRDGTSRAACADGFETFEIWHVRTSKWCLGTILRILRFGALNNGFLTIGVGYIGPKVCAFTGALPDARPLRVSDQQHHSGTTGGT